MPYDALVSSLGGNGDAFDLGPIDFSLPHQHQYPPTALTAPPSIAAGSPSSAPASAFPSFYAQKRSRTAYHRPTRSIDPYPTFATSGNSSGDSTGPIALLFKPPFHRHRANTVSSISSTRSTLSWDSAAESAGSDFDDWDFGMADVGQQDQQVQAGRQQYQQGEPQDMRAQQQHPQQQRSLSDTENLSDSSGLLQPVQATSPPQLDPALQPGYQHGAGAPHPAQAYQQIVYPQQGQFSQQQYMQYIPQQQSPEQQYPAAATNPQQQQQQQQQHLSQPAAGPAYAGPRMAQTQPPTHQWQQPAQIIPGPAHSSLRSTATAPPWQQPAYPAVAAYYPASAASQTPSPMAVGPWQEAQQHAVPSGQSTLQPGPASSIASITPRSSESFAVQQGLGQMIQLAPPPPGYHYAMVPTASLMQGQIPGAIQVQQGPVESSREAQPTRQAHSYGTWSATAAAQARSVRGVGGQSPPHQHTPIKPDSVVSEPDEGSGGEDDNEAPDKHSNKSSSVPGYVTSVARNVAPHVKAAFEANRDPNDPFAPTTLTRPPQSYAALIGQAIMMSEPPRQLLISDIFSRIVDHYPYYAANPRLLYNGIRHAMTISAAFEKIPRQWGDQSGKARKWGIRAGHENWFTPDGNYLKGGPNPPKPATTNKKSKSGGGGTSESPEQLAPSQDPLSVLPLGAQPIPLESHGTALPAEFRPFQAQQTRGQSRPALPGSDVRTITNVAEGSRKGLRSSTRLRRGVPPPQDVVANLWLPSETQDSYTQRAGTSPRHIYRTPSGNVRETSHADGEQ